MLEKKSGSNRVCLKIILGLVDPHVFSAVFGKILVRMRCRDQESECLAEERLREAQTAALHQAIEARPTLPRQQSWQRNRRTSLQETKRSRIVDAPQSKSEGDMMSCQTPRFTRAVSPSESSC